MTAVFLSGQRPVRSQQTGPQERSRPGPAQETTHATIHRS